MWLQDMMLNYLSNHTESSVDAVSDEYATKCSYTEVPKDTQLASL